MTATNSAEPVLRREWLTPGVHINAVGACLPHMRELDTATVADAALFGDSRDSVLAEAGDYVLAAAEGAIGPDHIQAELGDLSAGGGKPGRTGEREITIFESLGLAVEDLAAAALAYRNRPRSQSRLLDRLRLARGGSPSPDGLLRFGHGFSEPHR